MNIVHHFKIAGGIYVLVAVGLLIASSLILQKVIYRENNPIRQDISRQKISHSNSLKEWKLTSAEDKDTAHVNVQEIPLFAQNRNVLPVYQLPTIYWYVENRRIYIGSPNRNNFRSGRPAFTSESAHNQHNKFDLARENSRLKISTKLVDPTASATKNLETTREPIIEKLALVKFDSKNATLIQSNSGIDISVKHQLRNNTSTENLVNHENPTEFGLKNETSTKPDRKTKSKPLLEPNTRREKYTATVSNFEVSASVDAKSNIFVSPNDTAKSRRKRSIDTYRSTCDFQFEVHKGVSIAGIEIATAQILSGCLCFLADETITRRLFKFWAFSNMIFVIGVVVFTIVSMCFQTCLATPYMGFYWLAFCIMSSANAAFVTVLMVYLWFLIDTRLPEDGQPSHSEINLFRQYRYRNKPRVYNLYS
ncbi:unnamed protein product [Allacma fusca]|uniref:Uncharacterized protein n=1 Tax=Allacma fusca TaxID=39272 RepID=A0A8J2PW81_9HEXA|nr:unnamed protein product [Allacma fusca]